MPRTQRSDSQKRFRRSKQSERDLGHWLLENDGPDLRFKGIASSTGRVGHITSLQFDVVSKSYAAENKQVKVPARLYRWWKQILQVAQDQNKEALLRIEPTNIETGPNPQLRKKPGSLHIITEDRHAELLRAEKEVHTLQMALLDRAHPGPRSGECGLPDNHPGDCRRLE
jgi:hypothetical protein